MTEHEILEQISKDVALIKQGLYGVPETGDMGMCGDVKDLCARIERLNGRERKLSKAVWILWGVIGAGGGAGIWSLFT